MERPDLHHQTGYGMKLPLTHCPVCNALERMARHERRVGDLIFVYTRCSTCRSEFPIETLSGAQKRQRERAERERRRALRGQSRLRRWPSGP